jgi:hypothetical protein
MNLEKARGSNNHPRSKLKKYRWVKLERGQNGHPRSKVKSANG